MNILTATAAHAEQIATLHAASWASSYADVLSAEYLRDIAPADRRALWRRRLGEPPANQLVLVAERDGQMAGFACCNVAEHADWGSYLNNLHVAAVHQGQGLGRRLLGRVAQLCEQASPGLGLYLLVNQANSQAQRFYSVLGAQNEQASVWHAPDGSAVPTFVFRWPSVAALAAHALP
ncbi:GNAT family N-acetyltransferase [Chitinolyticbacter albus]|uniref:GNAT family N-acetyltransferase n=1 Tax=Chitinolyticbacter albus TaxID=2961951 RepID=UPI00210C9093|nr:GNAT family N-acetyltransferase [Chitinolyticbacter albus]